VFVTHDQEEALELADRVVVMRNGRIEQVGTPEAIYRHPSSSFVYEFIGRANSLSGEYGDGRFRPDGCSLHWNTDLAGAGNGRLFVRPHDLSLSDQGHPAIVVAAHRRADRTTLELKLDGQLRSVELDLVAASDAVVPATGANVAVKPLEYRVYPA
jgi:sulfate transport system ATP-binding protein